MLHQLTQMQAQMKGWRSVPLTSIQHEIGFAYLAVTGHAGLSSHKDLSSACVLENGVPLPGLGNALHDDIRQVGRGRYSFWHDYVYFSTSDNSDPRTNGRYYEISYPPTSIGSVVARLFYIVASPFGIHALLRWGNRIASQLRQLPKKIPYAFWTMVYWSLFAWVYRQGRRNLKNPNPRTLVSTKRESLLNTISTSCPVNFQGRQVSEDTLIQDVQYAAQVGQSYIRSLPESHKNLCGKIVLELGPGINFGSTLILACKGAKVIVADRFLAPWEKYYHPQLYSLLKDWIQKNMPEADVTPLERILSQGKYCEEIILCYSSPLEDLSVIPETSVDIVFSNAVLEHLYDPLAAFRNLARISKPFALGIHQVDFRYHQMMDRPLEFLLLSDSDFAKKFEEVHGECGNRYRPHEYKDLFEKVGFQVKFEPSLYVEDAYIKEFIPRLRSANGSKYQYTDLGDLRVISGLFTLVRKSHA
jgi:SAM-dependent methyltransferase